MNTHLSPEDFRRAVEIGRNLPPLTSEQKAVVADVMGPLLRAMAAEAKPSRRTRKAAA